MGSVHGGQGASDNKQQFIIACGNSALLRKKPKNNTHTHTHTQPSPTPLKKKFKKKP